MKNHLVAVVVALGGILAGCSSSSGGGAGTSCASSDGSQCVEVNSGTTCPSPLTSVSSCPSGGELGECAVTSGSTTEYQYFYCKGEAVTTMETASTIESTCKSEGGTWTAGSVSSCGSGATDGG